MDGGDHRLADLVEDLDPARRHVRAQGRKRGGVVLGLDVGAGAEAALAGPADDDRADVGVGVQAHEGLGGLAAQGGIDRVDLTRTIEDDPAHTIDVFDLDGGGEGLVCHGRHAPTKV